MQLNRAKFMVNGGIGYVLKPPPMCKGKAANTMHMLPKNAVIMKQPGRGQMINHAKDEKCKSNTNVMCLILHITNKPNATKKLLPGLSGDILLRLLPGSFNPFSDDPLPAYPKKQLVLKIISGQQLPKPPDSMLGDRGEVETHQKTYNQNAFSVSILLCLTRNAVTPLNTELTRTCAAFSSIRSSIRLWRWRSSVCPSTAARSRRELWMTTVGQAPADFVTLRMLT